MAINPATLVSIEQARRALAALINGTVQVREREYISLMDRVLVQLRRLLLAEADAFIDSDEDDPDFTLNLANMREQERLRRLMRSLQLGMSEWADTSIRTALNTAVKEAVPLAETVEEDVIRSQLPPEQQDFAQAASPELLEKVIGRTEDRMQGVLEPFSRQYASDINQALIDGIAFGQNPREAARQLTDSARRKMQEFGTDALRFMRTEMLDAYRNADLAARTTNQAILRGWMWYSAGDERTCASCWAMHGTEYTVTTPGPDDHPNGRCVAIAIVRDDLALPDQPPIPSREELWNRLSPAQKRGVMGPTRGFLFETGRIGWEDLSKRAGGGEHYRPFHVARPVRELEHLAVMREPVVRGGMADHLRWTVANFPDIEALGELPQHHGQLHQSLASQYLNLTKEDDAALQHWITAEGFQMVNGILRGNPSDLAYLRQWAADNGIENLVDLEDTRVIALIDLMMRDNPIDPMWLNTAGFMNEDGEEGIRVYRAFADESMVMRRWQVGDRYQDDGYMATTMDRSFAEEWVFLQHDMLNWGRPDQDEDPIGVVYAIEVPAGARGMFIGGAGQQELLLARGTTLEVVGFDDSNRPIFRAISDTATIPPDDADLFSWMRDGIHPMVQSPSFPLGAIEDPSQGPIVELGIMDEDSLRIEQGIAAFKRGLHRSAEEIAAPLTLEVGIDEDIRGADIIRDVLNPMIEEGAFINPETDRGVQFAIAALQTADDVDMMGPEDAGTTIALIDEARDALVGAVNYRLEVFRDEAGEPESAFMDIMSIGSTGIVPGGGTRLMHEAIKVAASVGASISLTSIDTAMGFYEHLGMKPADDGGQGFFLSADEVRRIAREVR